MTSLDPRVNRLPHYNQQEIIPKAPLDQFSTYEVFVQAKEGKSFQHEGIVHASDIELAYVLAKESFTRRFECISLKVVDTRDVYTSATTDGSQNIYSFIEDIQTSSIGDNKSYEIYHLAKRGKQHTFAGTVDAVNPREAIVKMKTTILKNIIVYNVWAICCDCIRYTTEEEKDIWNTLPEKKYRDASAYKAGDKLSEYLKKK